MHRLKGRLTYGNVVATIALFVALGGSSYAAITLPRNSVGANQIRTGGVRSSEVKDRSLSARDLSTAARTFLKGRRGPQGPKGDPGQTQVITDQGPVTLTSFTTETATGTVGRGETGGGSATCPAGRRVTGGGVRIDSAGDTAVRESYPSNNSTAWTGRVENNNEDLPGQPTGPFNFTVFAICAST
jgi:hypothetical protein